MKKENPNYMTTRKERLSYWTYFVGQNAYYYITAAFISTYLAMQGIDLKKVLEMVRLGCVGNLVEVDSADGDKIRIFVE